MDADAAAAVERLLAVPRRYRFDETLRFQRFGPGDPTAVRRPGTFLKAARTPDGPVTLALHQPAAGEPVLARAWGNGAGWALARIPGLLGLDDQPGAFAPREPLLRLARRYDGLHLSRTPFPWDALWKYVLQQRVRFEDAARAHRWMVRVHGAPAPGPEAGVRLGPEPASLGVIMTHEWRHVGVDAQRARTLVTAGRALRHVQQLADLDLPTARARLSTLRGCGPWTVEMVMGFALGDADAVPLGDLHLPHLVCRALAGDERGSDVRMLELLEPWRPHRFRVIRLLFAAAVDGPRRSSWSRAVG